MLKIFNTIAEVREEFLEDKSEEFKKGFLACLDFFLIGIRSNYQYNHALRCRELEKVEKDQLEEIRLLKNKISNLQTSISSRSLISSIPTKKYSLYNVRTIFGDFSIMTNMDKDTFYLCLNNFSLRYSYESSEIAKSKLIQYINSKNFSGFKAFKDEKSYSRYTSSFKGSNKSRS